MVLHRPSEPAEFIRKVAPHLTGKETEAWEIIYFKLFKSQLPVVEKTLETAALMLGSDKSRGYCLEMICADFLAGANPLILQMLNDKSYAFDTFTTEETSD
jgi:hypothetical protein